jgi:hypothetical protein
MDASGPAEEGHQIACSIGRYVRRNARNDSIYIMTGSQTAKKGVVLRLTRAQPTRILYPSRQVVSVVESRLATATVPGWTDDTQPTRTVAAGAWPRLP